VNITSIY